MKTIDPETITPGMRLRITRTLKPNGALVSGKLVHEGTVASTFRPAATASTVDAITFAGDALTYSVTPDDQSDITLEVGEWPEGTIAYADIVADPRPELDMDSERRDVLIRRDPYGWVELDNYRRHADVDIDSGQVRLNRLRVIHDGRVPE